MYSRLLSRFAPSALVLFAASVLPAQAAVQNRINAPVTGSSRVAIQHTIPARALRAQDLGAAPADRKLGGVTLYFSLTAAQQADLNQLLIDQQNPNSPSYHQWLTPAQFGARFGLSSADLTKVTGWLTGQGLTVVSVAPSANYVSVSGTVAQVEQAFGVSIHAMSENGVQHIANITDPQLPAAIANIVTGITGLHDFKPMSRARVSTPKYTSSTSGNHYIAPGDFYTIYDVNQLISGNSINGSGISIAIMGQTDISTTDVTAFRSASGLSSTLPTIVKVPGYVAGTIATDIDEAQLDVEWSGAVAPNATILFVTVGASPTLSVMDSLSYAISSNVAPIISISYGNCESGWGQSELNSINQELQQANAQGITVIGPAGDSGATDCDTAPPADFGFAVDFPGSSPFVTSAGGSMFNEGSATGTTSYWNSNSSSSTANAGSAISYIPETVWNESDSTGLGAGGGGVSAYFSKPAWQVGTGVPSDSSRDVPDVSFNAAASHDGYLFCSQGSCTNGFRNAAGSLNVVGGTSAAAPTLAGVFALLEQQLGGGTANRIGNANPMIYGLANSTYYNNVFHDITSGNNDSPCQQGTTNCPNGGNIGYNAGTGYDLATGWGSLDVYNFVTKWKLATPTGAGVTTGSAISSTTITTTAALCSNSSGSVAITIAVANASGTTLAAPTGTVQILVDNAAVTGTNTATLSGGSATFTVNTSSLSSGGHTFSAIYLGDGSYAASKGSLYVDIVSSLQKDFALTPCTAPSTATSGSSAAGIAFTITPANGFTGTVNLTASVDSTVAASYTFSPATITVSSGSPVTANLVLTASQSSTSGTSLIAQNSHPASHTAPWYIAGSGASLACMMLLVLPRRRRWGALLALLLSVAAISTSGCGGSSSSSSSSSGSGGTTPTTTFAARGTYTVNVTAISGSLIHTSTVTFTVQ
jgi:subtilase family serine protease